MDDATQRLWDDWVRAHVEVVRDEVMLLADDVGEVVGRLERRVRELENQLGFEKRIRELELKIIKLSADMDADHSRTGAPLIPLKGGRDGAA